MSALGILRTTCAPNVLANFSFVEAITKVVRSALVEVTVGNGVSYSVTKPGVFGAEGVLFLWANSSMRPGLESASIRRGQCSGQKG